MISLPSRGNEKQLLFLRPHWMTILPIMVAFAIILVLPFAVWFGLQIIHPTLLATPGYATVYLLGASMFFLFTWLFLFQNFVDYFLDLWIVTDVRIMDVQQHGLFGRTTAELMLENVQDATSEVNGFVRTLLDYGTLTIQTAGQEQRFVMENIPHPTKVARQILELANVRRGEEKGGRS